MSLKLIALLNIGLYGCAGFSAAADASSIRLNPQVKVDALDQIADQTHGTLKWSNGAFLYMDATGTLPPAFHTLNREGKLVSSATLNVPGASQFWFNSFDRGPDGSVVFAGGAYSAEGQASPLLAWISPDGRTEHVVRTAPYHPHLISVAPDATLWTIGCEMIDRKYDAPGVNPNAGVLRHFDRAGKLIGSFFPQSEYVAAQHTIWLELGSLVATRDRLAWYAPNFGHPGRYVEIDLASMELKKYHGLPKLTEHAKIDHLAVTDDGVASLSVSEPLLPHHWSTYTFDRGISEWIQATVAVSDFPAPRVLGADANQLVLLQGRGAGFFSVSH